MQAVRLAPTYAEAYRLRGQLLFAQESVDQALIGFTQACSIDKDMASFAGKSVCSCCVDAVLCMLHATICAWSNCFFKWSVLQGK